MKTLRKKVGLPKQPDLSGDRSERTPAHLRGANGAQEQEPKGKLVKTS
jgi:hypothetical protein